jgi:hypothetical protein
MYSFIFYFIYLGQISQKNTGPYTARLISSMIVTLFLFIHICFIYAMVKFILFHFYNISIAFSSGKTHSITVIFWYPIGIFSMIILFKYFSKKRVDSILKKYEENQFSYSLYNILKFMLIFILPLILAIWMVKKSTV